MPFSPLKLDPSTPASQEETASLRQFVTILRRRWRMLVLLWIATIIASTFYTLNLPRIYRPQAMLEIRPETSLLATDAQDPTLQASRDLWDNYYRTQEAILTSATLHAEVLRALPESIRKS